MNKRESAQPHIEESLHKVAQEFAPGDLDSGMLSMTTSLNPERAPQSRSQPRSD